MALTNLKSYTQEEFDSLDIKSFPKAPKRTNGGTPDTRANTQLRGWIGTDVLAFTISANAGVKSELAIDEGKAKTLDINVTKSSTTTTTTTYWTVNMGSDNNQPSDWSITYDVQTDTSEKGTWVFVKGKSDDDEPVPTVQTTLASKENGLDNLSSYDKDQYEALGIRAFELQPGKDSSGSWPQGVNIKLDGWVGDDLLAFRVINSIKSDSGLRITDDQISVEVVAGLNPVEIVGYYTVDMGPDNSKSDEWSITYAASNTSESGTWVFVKGKSDDDDDMGAISAADEDEASGLAHLTQYSESEYNALGKNAFVRTPRKTISGNPPATVQIHPDGWVGDDLLAFRVINSAKAGSGLRVAEDQINIDVVTGVNPEAEQTYWTVDMGPDNNRYTEWAITYAVSNSSESGSWVFVKGKSDDDDNQAANPGCLFGWLKKS